jgi:hypothetical protein
VETISAGLKVGAHGDINWTSLTLDSRGLGNPFGGQSEALSLCNSGCTRIGSS